MASNMLWVVRFVSVSAVSTLPDIPVVGSIHEAAAEQKRSDPSCRETLPKRGKIFKASQDLCWVCC